VDLPSPRIIALTLIIFALSILDAVFTIIHLENGAFELNPVMDRIIQSGFQNALITKSLGVGLIAWFLATHQNFKISFYGMYVLAGTHIALLAYHLVFAFLFQAI